MKRQRASNFGGGFWGCSFCRGTGCLACQQESKRQYSEAFPDGPKPILTWTARHDGDLANMQDDGCPNVDLPQSFHVEDIADSPLAGLLQRVLAASRGGKCE